MAADTYVPRHRAESAPTGRQAAREEASRLQARAGKPVKVRARHAGYGTVGSFGPVVMLRHPDDRLPLGLAATTGQEAA